MPVDRSPAVPRLCVQIRGNASRGVPCTQAQLADDLSVSMPRISEIIGIASERGLVERGDLAAGSRGRRLRAYRLTAEGRAYADEQLQGAGP